MSTCWGVHCFHEVTSCVSAAHKDLEPLVLQTADSLLSWAGSLGEDSLGTGPLLFGDPHTHRTHTSNFQLPSGCLVDPFSETNIP